jgi:hypothetical protein
MQNNPILYPTIAKTVKNTLFDNGIKDFWKGVEYTTSRAIVVTSCQFAVYEQIKQELIENKTIKNSNLIFNICKNRAINNKENVSIFNIIHKEGIISLWKGLSINITRQIPLNLIRFSLFEFYRNLLT